MNNLTMDPQPNWLEWTILQGGQVKTPISDLYHRHPTAIPLSARCLVFDNLAEEIMAFLPIIDVVRLGNMNHCLRVHVDSHLSRAFHALLQQYFPYPTAFRDAMRDTGTILSGSSVLCFIMRDTHWTPGDLDIYAPHGEAAVKISEHLLSIQGFTLRDPPGGYTPWSNSFQTIHRYEKTTALNGCKVAKVSLDLIESKTPSPVQPITAFHSTLVMNYLTADSVVVLYPLLTFARKGVRQLGIEHSVVSKYKKRGFEILGTNLCGSSCPNRKRSTYDSVSFRVVFKRGAAARVNELTRWKLEVTGGPLNGWSWKCPNVQCPYAPAHRLGMHMDLDF